MRKVGVSRTLLQAALLVLNRGVTELVPLVAIVAAEVAELRRLDDPGRVAHGAPFLSVEGRADKRAIASRRDDTS